MADLFISYKSDDRPQVQLLVMALRKHGFSVWWDRDIEIDAPWEQTIERELRGAKASVVVWSPAAVVSNNVKSEARWARKEGKLVQVFIGHCDPPLFFGEHQGVNLEGWRGDTADHRFLTVAAAVTAIVEGKRPPRGVGYAPRSRQRWRTAAAGTSVAAVSLSLLGAFSGSARDAVCSLHPVEPICLKVGLIKPLLPPPDPAAARARLIQSIAGDWRRTDGSCRKPLDIAVATDAVGVSRITVSTKDGYRREGQVVAADNGVVVTQDNTDRGYMQYRPNGDQLTGRDAKDVDTTLVRCPAHPS
jgi:hypothetical protein